MNLKVERENVKMKLTVKGKEREFKFDKIGFIRKLDDLYKAEKEGIEFGLGLVFADMYLEQYSVPQLSQIMKCASVDKSVTVTDIDEAIEVLVEEDEENFVKLFDEVRDEMGKSNIIKAVRKQMDKMEEKGKAKQAKS